MFFWDWVGEERDDDYGDEVEDEEDDGEVEEVDFSDDGGFEFFFIIFWIFVFKV